MGASFGLQFVSDRSVQLFSTTFCPSGGRPASRTIRGKTAGAYGGYGTFLWTRAVQAMCLLFVRSKLRSDAGDDGYSLLLSGGRGSSALSLDMSINAGTLWLFDMFGADRAGDSNAKRIFPRSNSEMKFPGPVSIGLNRHVIDAARTSIRIDGWEAENAALQELERSLGALFRDELRAIGPVHSELIAA